MRKKHALSGFSLIELMVGLTISLLGLLALGQIMLTFSQTRNSITQTTSAQSNGVMALYLIEKDLAQAGFSMMELQNCDRINFHFNGTSYDQAPLPTALPASGTVALTALPVRIISGGTGSDTLEIQYGNPRSGIPGVEINNVQANYADDYLVTSNVGFVTGDMIVANIPPAGGGTGVCTMAVVTAPTKASPTTIASKLSWIIEHVPAGSPYNLGADPNGATAGWEPATTVLYSELSTPNIPFLANLGSFISNRYTLVSANGRSVLNVGQLPAFTANPLVDEIVFLKAQYGLAAAGCTGTACAQVAGWSDAANFVVTAANSSRINAIRVGLLARSPLYEKDAPAGTSEVFSVLPAAPGVTAATTVADPGAGTCATDTTTWEVKCRVDVPNYRFRAYSTVVPLKNVIWNH